MWRSPLVDLPNSHLGVETPGTPLTKTQSGSLWCVPGAHRDLIGTVSRVNSWRFRVSDKVPRDQLQITQAASAPAQTLRGLWKPMLWKPVRTLNPCTPTAWCPLAKVLSHLTLNSANPHPSHSAVNQDSPVVQGSHPFPSPSAGLLLPFLHVQLTYS